MTPRTFTAIVERDPSGWWAVQCEELPAAISQGRTRAEALENLKDAIRLVLEEQRAMAEAERQREGRTAVREAVEVAIA